MCRTSPASPRCLACGFHQGFMLVSESRYNTKPESLMPQSFDRRRFLGATSVAFAALVASGCRARMTHALTAEGEGYGDLVPDPAGLLDLPQGFSYRVLSKLGDPMSDGGSVPDAADGMGCFDIGNGKWALVRNHELRPGPDAWAQLTSGSGPRPRGPGRTGGTTHPV